VGYRLRHEWPARTTRILTAEIASCFHCGAVRVVEEGRPTRYLMPLYAGGDRDRVLEPPCVDPPPRRRRERERLSAPELLKSDRSLRDVGEGFARTDVLDGEPDPE